MAYDFFTIQAAKNKDPDQPAQADLGLCCWRMSEDTFSLDPAQMIQENVIHLQYVKEAKSWSLFSFFSYFRMVRQYVRKPERCLVTKDIVLRAVNEVISENRSIRSVAEKYGLKNPMTLSRDVKKVREHGLENFQFGYNNKRQVFSDAQELQL